MNDRTILYCPHCQQGLRLPLEKLGMVTCPNCENEISADTTALGLAMQDSWWVPKWYWLLFGLIIIYGFMFLGAPGRYNPEKTVLSH